MIETLDIALIPIISHSNLAIYHKSTYCVGLKVFNSSPPYIKDKLQDIKEVKD